MPEHEDAFDRAVAREQRSRRREEHLDRSWRQMRFVAMWCFAALAGWAVVVAGHWVVLPEPRWLAAVHTLVLAVAALKASFAFLFTRNMYRRRERWFPET